MAAQRIGIVHPGQMGITVAASAFNSGNQVFWVSAGRSPATRERATQAGLQDAGTLAKLCELCPVIVSVCPPESAEEMAEQILQHAYHGVYVDANAIAPERARAIASRLEECGALFVDGGIIGPPATARGKTWLYLSGEHAASVTSYFSAGPLETEVLAGAIGQASALKMCFAAYSKGSIALLCSVLAAAQRLEVLDDLKRQWIRSGPSLPDLEREISRSAPKAWRFAGEMHEIAATFQSAGMPPQFHQAAAEIFRRLENFKGGQEPSVKDVLGTLLK
jgi:3-hydroxyisobutyrate dehydrogenase-like beta-hydroxyacid dehydrogenase